jgi:hypothetical protein
LLESIEAHAETVRTSINSIKTLTEVIERITEAVGVSINGIETPADIIEIFIKSVKTPVEAGSKCGEPNSLIQ